MAFILAYNNLHSTHDTFNLGLNVWVSLLERWMLRAPPLISSDLHFSVLYCHCRTYNDTVGPKLQKRVIVFESFYPFFSPCHFCAVGVATFGHKFINSREK